MTYDLLENEQAFAEFLNQFERGTLPKAIWTHAAHLAIGTWYLVTIPEEKAAIDRVRTGIQHYNVCVGTANTGDSGYHETLTLFWLNTIQRFLADTGGMSGTLDKVRSVVAEFSGQRDLFRQYYSFDVVASREARARWMPPDRIVSRSGNKSTLRDI
ncbi:MAG TPA: hypothetical protein VGP62_24115 [Bryobacteraceae bacterium]|jgi:hypothetical protein|nr:hypothetical protein [Bryobacteraceae bacterium]